MINRLVSYLGIICAINPMDAMSAVIEEITYIGQHMITDCGIHEVSCINRVCPDLTIRLRGRSSGSAPKWLLHNRKICENRLLIPN